MKKTAIALALSLATIIPTAQAENTANTLPAGASLSISQLPIKKTAVFNFFVGREGGGILGGITVLSADNPKPVVLPARLTFKRGDYTTLEFTMPNNQALVLTEFIGANPKPTTPETLEAPKPGLFIIAQGANIEVEPGLLFGAPILYEGSKLFAARSGLTLKDNPSTPVVLTPGNSYYITIPSSLSVGAVSARGYFINE